MNQDIASFFPPARFGEITKRQQVSDGLSGASVHAVTTTQGEYILRVFHGDEAVWARSLPIQRLVAGHGIAPPLLHVDEARRATVARKIAAIPLAGTMARPETRQAAMASLLGLLQKMQSLPVEGLAHMDAVALTRSLWQAQCARAGFPAWAAPLAQALDAVGDCLAQDPRLVLGHGDLNPGNILWDGTRVWLVDWDQAGLTHPYLDLACLANFIGVPDAVALGLLAMQEQAAITSGQQAVFRACQTLSRIAYGSIFLSLVAGLDAHAIAAPADTPSLPECLARVGSGELSLADAAGQCLMGAAFLKLGMEGMQP